MRCVWDVVIGLVFVNVLHHGINITAHVRVHVYAEQYNRSKEIRPCLAWLTALRDRESVCRMSSMVRSTRPLHNRWGKLRTESKSELWTWNPMKSVMCDAARLRFSKAWQILVSHPANPLVDVVEVDQKELSMTFELLLMGFGFWLKLEHFIGIISRCACKDHMTSNEMWNSFPKVEINKKHLSYLINHHLQEDLKDFVTHSNHTLHHSWSEMKIFIKSVRQMSNNKVLLTLLTRLILLYCSVFKISKHDLKSVRVQRVQHPVRAETQNETEVLTARLIDLQIFKYLIYSNL